MSRPIRIELPGALYHVTSRGNALQTIFTDDEDRVFFLDTLDKIARRFHWTCHAYCLMKNHYHLVLETANANLSAGMRELNGLYTQRFNRHHAVSGQVMQGRFKAILFERESYLLPLCRYVVLNPLRVGKSRNVEKYRWSSYRATAGLDEAAACLSTEWVLSQFGKQKKRTLERYQAFVAAGIGQPAPWDQVAHQILLGSAAFVEKMRPLMDPANKRKAAKSKVQGGTRRPTLARLFAKVKDKSQRNAAIRIANREHLYSLSEIGSFVGLHFSTISKIANSTDE
jgi:REP element-mobilizing transposase RayT